MIAPGVPVHITGMGCITAAGNTVAATLAALEKGERNFIPPQWGGMQAKYPVFACAPLPLEDFPSLPAIQELQGRSRTVLLAAHAIGEALALAGIALHDLARLRVGVCIGTSVGTALDFYDYYRAYRKGEQEPLDVVHRYLNSNPSLALAQILRTQGPVHTVANACSSGADAIGIATQWIRSGRCDVAICGGADALDQVIYHGFSSLKLLSSDPCTPFDKARSGLNIGEGAGILILESAERVRTRPVLGRIRGYGTCTDAYHLTAPHPEARGLEKALAQAMRQADVSIDDIAFINAHGTATPTNDAVEGRFFARTFADTPFIATKGCTGHTLGAAGGIEAVLTLAHLRGGRLPASPGFAERDPAIGAAPVSAPVNVRTPLAMSQSLAFGGNNSILLIDTEVH